MPRPPEEMPKSELVNEVRELRQHVQGESDLRDLIEALTVHQEELRQHQDDLKVARVELETSRDRYAELFDFAPTAFLTLDLDGMVRESNLATAQLLGVPRARLDGFPLMRWISDDYRQLYLDEINRARRGERVVHCELQVDANDRRRIAVELTLKRVNPQNRDPILYGILTDLTERKRAEDDRLRGEQERARLENETSSARRANEAKDQFLAMLSHELRTPLTPMMLGLGLLESSSDMPLAVRSTISMISRNVRLEARLIDDLLDLTRISRGKLRLDIENVDLHTLLGDVVTMCQGEIEAAGHQVELDLRAPRRYVEGDATRLRQVFWNLLQNAVRLTPPSGHIRMTTRASGRGHVCASVEDSGPGIAADEIERIFEPFEQGESSSRYRRGLGLGLAVSRGFVEAHGGALRAANTGAGARFDVVLPVSEPPPEVPVGQLRPDRKRHALDILLVEDHADTAEALAEILRRHGYRVRLASTLGEARAEAAEPFDVLLSDVQLPDGSGLELMQELRKKGSVIGIAMTGFGAEHDVHRSFEVGFQRHLVKPVTGDQVIEAIEDIVARRE
jgi:PAS domain S-box-containing protein